MRCFSTTRFRSRAGLALLVTLAASSLPGVTSGADLKPRELRTHRVRLAGNFDRRVAEWTGFGVAYGPYRDGQRPGGPEPTEDQRREDLRIMAKHWGMLRTYGANETTRSVCAIIREEKLPLYVMAGAWLAQEGANDPPLAANREQVREAIAIARDYPDVVIAICIGNETQEDWSGQRVDLPRLIDYVRQARDATADIRGTADDFPRVSMPVTVADVDAFWTRADGLRLAEEVDFITTHVYAMWNRQSLDQAMPFTKRRVRAVKYSHPDRLVVLGEAGWATDRSERQTGAITGKAGEEEQARFYREFKDWAMNEGPLPVFYFSAFDENWKSNLDPPDPRDAEKHWGVYRADRTPKPAVTQFD